MTDQNSPIATSDPELWKLIDAEQNRQEHTLELIASENHVSPSVMAAAGSCLTNKYAEGYPGRRYYSGCVNYDQVEDLARDRAKKLFGCAYANVQPHSGAQANMAVFFALLEPGDKFMSIVLSDGGHLTHGSPVNMSGKWFQPIHYPLVYDESKPNYGHVDYDAVEALAMEHKPKLILCGFSAYPRIIDFKRFREIADKCGAMLMADIAHIAGLCATGQHPSPFPHCHVVTTTTHKTLRGPRGGLILTDDKDLSIAFNKAVFPGIQGGPLMHIIAAKAAAFGEALKPEFKTYCEQIVKNAAALAAEMKANGYHLCSGGTDNHLMLVDLRKTDPDLTGKQGSLWLEQANIIANMNTVPGDDRSPMQTSGIRMGSPALTTRGLKEAQMKEVADLVHRVLSSKGDEATLASVKADVETICKQYPMPH